MSILSRAKFRLWWERASWVIPLTGIVLALMLNEAVRNLDEALYAAKRTGKGRAVVAAHEADDSVPRILDHGDRRG